MHKIIITALAAFSLSTGAYANYCELGEQCSLYNEIKLSPPYIGTYSCFLSAGDMEDIDVEIKLMVGNSISVPASLILSRGPNTEGKHLGELIIKKNPNLPDGSLKNAISISAPLHVIMCDMTKPNTCDVPRTVMCVRMGD
jgi:hypothetical protein